VPANYETAWLQLQREILSRAEAQPKCANYSLFATALLGFSITVIALGSDREVHLVWKKIGGGENRNEQFVLCRYQGNGADDVTSWTLDSDACRFISSTGEGLSLSEFCDRIFKTLCKSDVERLPGSKSLCIRSQHTGPPKHLAVLTPAHSNYLSSSQIKF
jgi:hypothetical protein